MLLIYLNSTTVLAVCQNSHGFTGILQTQEPRQRRHRELDVNRLEMVMDDRETSLNEGLEYALVEKCPVHGGTTRRKFHELDQIKYDKETNLK